MQVSQSYRLRIYGEEAKSLLHSPQEVRRMHAIASAPDLYIDFCEAGGHGLVIRLLGHENGDIAGDAASLLREMTDADARDGDGDDDSREDVAILVAALAEADGLEALVARLASFDESVEEEAQGVQNILSAIEVISTSCLHPMSASDPPSLTSSLTF